MKSEPFTRNREVYKRYPIPSILTYNIATIFHYLVGYAGIITGYNFSLSAFIFGTLYMIFAFVQMYLLMPRKICPNCIYCHMSDGLCISGLNALSKRVTKKGSPKDFQNRAEGIFCHNNLYMAALIIPVIAMIPAVILNFTFTLLALFVATVGLLLFRVFVIFPKIACIHCSARKHCPNARAMGLDR